jgi:hypothetical protein
MKTINIIVAADGKKRLRDDQKHRDSFENWKNPDESTA